MGQSLPYTYITRISTYTYIHKYIRGVYIYIYICINALNYITYIHTHIYKYRVRTYVLLRTFMPYMHSKHKCLRYTDQNFILVSVQFLYEVFGRNPDYTLKEYPEILIFLLSLPNMGRVT